MNFILVSCFFCLVLFCVPSFLFHTVFRVFLVLHKYVLCIFHVSFSRLFLWWLNDFIRISMVYIMIL